MTLLLAFVFAIGGVICHQIPERSFFIAAHQLPVCARCTGLYLSGAAGFLGWVAVRTARRWRPIPLPSRTALQALAVGAAPTILSVAGGMSGVWDGSNLTRALLAIPLGIGAGAVVAAVAVKDLR